MPLENSKTALIILGASQFPGSKNFQSDTAFLEAKKRVYSYFTEKSGLALESTHLLDLFNSEEGPDAQDELISTFIDSMKKRGLLDLFIYYVGHGGFCPEDKSFILAINRTRDRKPSLSSISIRSLSSTIAKEARNLRTFVILDCCFSGEAGKLLMGGEAEALSRQMKDAMPDRGVALLCSTSADLPALIIKERNITMFTEAFEKALRKGDSSISSKYLSLRQIHQLTYSNIKRLNPGDEIPPQIFSPVQPEGEIAEIPHFYNYGFKESNADILAKKREIEEQIIHNHLSNASNLFIDFVRNFDIQEEYNIESIVIGSECNDLEEEKNNMDKEEYREKRRVLYLRIMQIVKLLLLQTPPGSNISEN